MKTVNQALSPLESLYEVDLGSDVTLPSALGRLYGRFQLPPHPGRPYVIANFVSTLDGVVTLGEPDHLGGGDISGFDAHDRMVMGLLRAISDAVVVGAGTLRALPGTRWTAKRAYPPLAEAYDELRTGLGKVTPPLNVIVTATGEVDVSEPVFKSGEVPVLIVTTAKGARRIGESHLPPSVRLAPLKDAGRLTARAILEAVNAARQCDIILVEGGPHLLGDFVGEQALDELFLTLSPQIAGRDNQSERPGIVAGVSFAPGDPRWATLIGVKRGVSLLFLRYAFEAKQS